jgi:two-component system osmolarity sensor histidine kinase EnvZ
MYWFQTVSNSEEEPSRATGFYPFRAIKHLLPHGLFGRSLIIVVAPVLILQLIVALVFFDRHYRIVTATLTRSVADEIGYMVTLENQRALGAERDRERENAARIFGLPASFLPGEELGNPVTEAATPLDRQLLFILDEQIPETASFSSGFFQDSVDVRVQVNDGVLQVLVPRARVEAANARIFVFWMLGSSLILIAVAVLFLRNQVKPIERLARAAEDFGKGRNLPGFKPYGATEVRRAAYAFIQMRERIDRHVQQRTDMLAGVSHDLRTPLTRLRLQLAMLPKDTDHDALTTDVAEMEHMIEEYLDFARGEGGEDPQLTNIVALLEDAAQDCTRARKVPVETVRLSVADGRELMVKRHALRRCLINLIQNALKYGTRAEIKLVRKPRAIEIHVNDDGPGIAEENREAAFRPFYRLDEARNLQSGGVGLGLAIARDIARAHGGDVRLDNSPLGGLCAVVRIPV